MSIDPADYWMTPAEERRLEDKLTVYDENMKTPRTDLIVTGNSDPTVDEYEDLATFTRQLERELAELKRECAAVRQEAEDRADRQRRVLPHLLIIPTCPHCDESFQVQSLNRTRDLWKCRSCKVEFTPER